MHDVLGHELSLIALSAVALKLDPGLDESQRAAAGQSRPGLPRRWSGSARASGWGPGPTVRQDRPTGAEPRCGRARAYMRLGTECLSASWMPPAARAPETAVSHRGRMAVDLVDVPLDVRPRRFRRYRCPSHRHHHPGDDVIGVRKIVDTTSLRNRVLVPITRCSLPSRRCTGRFSGRTGRSGVACW
ncbi:hypothetical protein ACFU8Q_01095 [Streptomyces sp. NPDC057543]|uniref:hypothetical protein n=1 Tax=Streptomyces sp. NPDC057543 TaxID=3346163 RepID=UPI003686AE2F